MIIGAVMFVQSIAAPASAELVSLTTGRTMSVKSHTRLGEHIVLVLRQGGEISCPASLVARIDPDEVPMADAASGVTGKLATRQGLDGPFSDLIRGAATRYGVDASLVHAVIRAESNYEPRARSRRGARGLMQLMPATLRAYQVRDAYDPRANLDAGTRHLRALLDRLPLAEALAAYNAGAGAVARHGGVPPFPETRSYVARVLGALDPVSSTP
jgi:soluble lytic murein transglycosylase-like protein